MQREELKDFLADKADDMKAVDIVTLDVQGKSSVTDYMIICTGTSKRHVS
ncbi:RsfS/YbeB/iojap family protein, partial [Vibrio fluvialis]|nr:RsfS/YbeB/iojap family protein [Vibrio fluvialis]